MCEDDPARLTGGNQRRGEVEPRLGDHPRLPVMFALRSTDDIASPDTSLRGTRQSDVLETAPGHQREGPPEQTVGRFVLNSDGPVLPGDRFVLRVGRVALF